MNKKGFTLIELLVVIAIIAILTTIAVVGLNNARDQSIASRTLNDLTTVEKALNSLMMEQERSIWWRGDIGGTDPDIGSISGIEEFLPNVPEPELSGVSQYLYSNEGNNLASDSQSYQDGVAIIMHASSTVADKFFPLMDSKGDYDTGESTGKLRRDSTGEYIFYVITPDEAQW